MHTSALSFPITGMGIVTPAGSDIEALWKSCLNKNSFIDKGLGEIKSLETKNLWSTIATSKWIKKTPHFLSKSLIFSLHAIIGAIEEAKWSAFNEDDVIIIGTTTGQICLWEKELTQFLKIENVEAINKNKLSMQPLQSLSDCLVETLDFPGRILILSSACSASTQAIIAAHDFLSTKRAKRCIVGGVEELSDLTINGFRCLKLLDIESCRPFDQSRVGINLSEGAAFYTVENSSLPISKVLAYLYAGESVLDSFHMTSPNPEGAGLQEAITSTLKKSYLSPDDIFMIHSHGTGSIHNDQAEASAISSIFKERPFVISTKGVHGHALGASGAIELGISLKILNENVIPPVTGLTQIDELIKINLPTEITKKEIKFLLKTTLGFGGVNSTFIIGKEGHA